jgi:type IV secretion system protein VirB5
MMGRSKKPFNPSAIEQAAQRNWNEAWGYHRDNARRWFFIGIAALGVAGVAVGSACWLAAQPKVTPFVIDRNGPSLTTAHLEAHMPDAARIKGHLWTWVAGMRTVSSDAAAQKRYVDQTYAWTDETSIAEQQLNEWFVAHKPNERAKTETVDVDIQSVIPQGGDVWQVDWSEISWPREPGHLATTTFWRMIVTVNIRLPETDAEIIANWDGVFAQSFHIQSIGRKTS